MALNRVPSFQEVKDWVNNNMITDHSQLSGVNEGDHRSDQRVSDLAPVQSVNEETGNVDLSAGSADFPSRQKVNIADASDGDGSTYVGQTVTAIWVSHEPRGDITVTIENQSGNTIDDFVVETGVNAVYYDNQPIGSVSWSTNETSQNIWAEKNGSHSHPIL